MNRAERRAQTERIKAKFYRKQKLNPYWGTSKASAGIYANHGCSCSCHMCGNPRRHRGELTMQERRISQREWVRGNPMNVPEESQ